MNKSSKFLVLIAVSALFALSFTSCGKDQLIEEKNKETSPKNHKPICPKRQISKILPPSISLTHKNPNFSP